MSGGKNKFEKEVKLMNIKEFFTDYADMEPGSWSRKGVKIEFGDNNVEIGLYREPSFPESEKEYAERYTFQVFFGDEVIICEDAGIE